MPPFSALVFLFILSIQAAHALNIVFGPPLGNLTASDLLNVADDHLADACQIPCTSATAEIKNCGDTNDTCLCDNSTIVPLVQCEQCMFTELVRLNIPQPDPRAGSQSALTAYATACNASLQITIPASSVALKLPSDWNGPHDINPNLFMTILALIFGVVLACSGIFFLNTM